MTEINQDDEILILWEAPKIEIPEFRLYYDEDTGRVICYSCEKLEGKYIVIDSLTYAQARPDVRIINGKISTASNHAIVSKLMPHPTKGQICEEEDISVISVEGDNTIRWKLNTYELK
jgi:hypothetical protein